MVIAPECLGADYGPGFIENHHDFILLIDQLKAGRYSPLTCPAGFHDEQDLPSVMRQDRRLTAREKGGRVKNNDAIVITRRDLCYEPLHLFAG